MALYVICSVQFILIFYLYKRIKSIDKALSELSIDIRLYERFKNETEANKRLTQKPITKVGVWKK